MKKVSWASRAGCCWGWKSVSKFQKELSTHWLVGISSKPMCRSTLRISVLTFMRGWSAPPLLLAPLTLLKFRGLNSWSFQAPLTSISFVTSATALAFCTVSVAVGVTLKMVRLVGMTILRFFSASSPALSRLAKELRSFWTSSVTESMAGVKAFVALSIAIHLFFIAAPDPTFPTSPRAASRSSFVAEPLALTALKTCTSGLPSLA
mmetsp:Transcript_52141/g.153864  ORF Transcript_52141/g.153864 Transcript_52141/m.153864 type:complete len:206 (-) Transcript_52141:271-888(-)